MFHFYSEKPDVLKPKQNTIKWNFSLKFFYEHFLIKINAKKEIYFFIVFAVPDLASYTVTKIPTTLFIRCHGNTCQSARNSWKVKISSCLQSGKIRLPCTSLGNRTQLPFCLTLLQELQAQDHPVKISTIFPHLVFLIHLKLFELSGNSTSSCNFIATFWAHPLQDHSVSLGFGCDIIRNPVCLLQLFTNSHCTLFSLTVENNHYFFFNMSPATNSLWEIKTFSFSFFVI